MDLLQCPANDLDSLLIFVDVILQTTLLVDISLDSRDQEQNYCTETCRLNEITLKKEQLYLF